MTVATLDEDIDPNIRMNPFWMGNVPGDRLVFLVHRVMQRVGSLALNGQSTAVNFTTIRNWSKIGSGLVLLKS